jgi:hypothetical protein
MRLVDPAAYRGNDLVDDAQEMLLVLETHREGLEDAGSLNIDAFVSVDQNVVDARILQQRLKRTETGHFIENFGDKIIEFLRVQCQPLDQHVLRHQLLHMTADFLFRHLVQRREVDFLDQAAVQADLGVEELVTEQRAFGRRGRRLLRRRQCPRSALRRERWTLFGRRYLGHWRAAQCETAHHLSLRRRKA